MGRTILLPVLLVLNLTVCNQGEGPISSTGNSGLEPVPGTQGMVSSAHPLASEAGIEILRQGGNAFDAAVAVAAALNVVEPANSGVGGYGTILIYAAEKKRVRFLDSSGKIPSGVDSDAFRSPNPGYLENRRGAKAVSTPGNINAWKAMSQEYGRLDWKTLFAPAVHLAEEGFALDDGPAGLIQYLYDSMPAHAREFYGKNGRPLQVGERLVQKDLAATLKAVADQGPAVFYSGRLGEAIHAEMERSGGFLSLRDLREDKAEWWEPISIPYRDFTVYTASPPATAFPSLIRLGIMSRFDLRKLGHNSTGYLHRFAEVTKHAFWCRLAYAGDPEIHPPPLGKLLAPSYWEKMAAGISLEQATPFQPPGGRIKEGRNTTHFVVADRWGNIVSATQTLGNAFGSRIMPPGTGIWLNNSLAYCTFEPKGNPMDAHPGHRKLSGDCPTIIFRGGRPWAALGTPGGHTIGQTVPQMVMNLIDFKMDIQEAIAAPRVSFIEPDTLALDAGISSDVVRELIQLGHKLREGSRLGNAHGLRIEFGSEGKPVRFWGAADPRGRGRAVGY
jgi:gamma-glutamyltranspeptidase/glutathione hydrolase